MKYKKTILSGLFVVFICGSSCCEVSAQNEPKKQMKVGAYYFAGWAGKSAFDDGTLQQPYIPVATVGWDRRPWESPDGLPWKVETSWYFTGKTPQAFEQFLLKMRQWMDDHPGQITKDRLAMLYAWNETGEGGWLVPCREDPQGAYLKAIKRVVYL